MTRILFICHGNICRSPMAEFVFKDLARRRGVSDRFFVASAATSTEEIICGVGNPVYPPARAELKKHGITCEGKRAVQLQKSDYNKYDLLLAMDEKNLYWIDRILGGDPEGKVKKLLSFAGRDGDIADPWYTGCFDATYRDVLEGCEALLTALLT